MMNVFVILMGIVNAIFLKDRKEDFVKEFHNIYRDTVIESCCMGLKWCSIPNTGCTNGNFYTCRKGNERMEYY
jgi:hypothetical protein